MIQSGYKNATITTKSFTKWPEYKDGIIDDHGNNIIKDSDKRQMDAFTNLVRKNKRVLEECGTAPTNCKPVPITDIFTPFIQNLS